MLRLPKKRDALSSCSGKQNRRDWRRLTARDAARLPDGPFRSTEFRYSTTSEKMDYQKWRSGYRK